MVNVSEGETLTLTNFQMKLFKAIAAAAVIGASFVAASPAQAFWGGKVAEQRKMILGTWDCTFETGGKIYRPDIMQFSFRRDGGLRSNLQMASSKMTIYGTWRLNKDSELVFPAGATTETKDLQTGATKSEPVKGTMYNDIVALNSTRLIFEREGGGEVYSCRK